MLGEKVVGSGDVAIEEERVGTVGGGGVWCGGSWRGRGRECGFGPGLGLGSGFVFWFCDFRWHYERRELRIWMKRAQLRKICNLEFGTKI